MKTVNVVCAIIIKDKKVLVVERGYGEFKGKYEFPGGKIESNESKDDALKREIKEELNVDIKIDHFFMNVKYQYSNFKLNMDCYICHLLSNKITLNEHTNLKWTNASSINNFDFIKADISIIDKLINDQLI